MGTQTPSQKRGGAPSPIFGLCLLWPNGCMDQDATWYGGRPQPRQHCVSWGPSSPLKGAQPPILGPCLLWPNGWMEKDAAWYGVIPRSKLHCVTWGPISPRQKGAQPPIFSPCLLRPNGCPSQLLLSSCLQMVARKPILTCKSCSDVCTYHCAQTSYRTQHENSSVNFPS